MCPHDNGGMKMVPVYIKQVCMQLCIRERVCVGQGVGIKTGIGEHPCK